MDVAELFEAARAGDREAFRNLVATVSPLLWHVARSQGLDRELSQDVVQTTWLSLMRDMPRIRNPRAVIGWLISTAKRESWRTRDRRRAEQPIGDLESLDRPDGAAEPAEVVGATDQRRRLWQAVERLPSRCRALLRIVAFVPRPDYGVIARTLGMKTGSIGPTRARCLVKLRRLLGVEDQS